VILRQRPKHSQTEGFSRFARDVQFVAADQFAVPGAEAANRCKQDLIPCAPPSHNRHAGAPVRHKSGDALCNRFDSRSNDVVR
jgi:hypothetical protein